jgi:signal transduction histidine kinase
VKLAEQARQSQQEFLAAICHDIRNPLHVVYGVVDSLSEEAEQLKLILEHDACLRRESMTKLREIQERIKGNVASLEKCADQQMVVLNDALDLAKMDNVKLKLCPVDFSVRGTFIGVMEMFIPQLHQKGLKHVLVLPDENVWVRADVKRLVQVVSNLVSNAIKFTPADGVISLRVLCEPNSPTLSVVVEDTGIGMSPEEISRIFKPYEQARSV